MLEYLQSLSVLPSHHKEIAEVFLLVFPQTKLAVSMIYGYLILDAHFGTCEKKKEKEKEARTHNAYLGASSIVD